MIKKHIIYDSLYGSIYVDDVTVSLINTAEVQRTKDIKQLGLAVVVFPGASHTRFSHSVGLTHLVGRLADNLNFSDRVSLILKAVAVLHDSAHLPFSHSLESLLKEYRNQDHMELARDVILGKDSMFTEEEEKRISDAGVPRVREVFKKYGLPRKEIANLVLGKHEKYHYMGECIHSEIDLDIIDYLERDCRATGVALGAIDVDRLLDTMRVHNNHLVVSSKGIEAVEGLLIARAAMFSSTYTHHTTRTAELMLANTVDYAVEQDILTKDNFYKMTDGEMMGLLGRAPDDFIKRMVMYIKNRLLFKRAIFIERGEIVPKETKSIVNQLTTFKKRKQLQQEIAKKAKVDPRYVIVDAPVPEILLTEPRVTRTNIRILTGKGEIKDLAEISPIALSIKKRIVPRYSFQVLAPKKYVTRVKKAAGGALCLG